jgi:hypothetical protein
MGLTDGSSTLEAWYKADTISQANGSSVATWTDSSGNGRTGTANGTPIFNTNQLNSIMPAISFTGSAANFAFSPIALPNLSIFGVARSTGDRYLLGHNANNRQVRMYQGGALNIAMYNGVQNPVSSATTTTTGNYLIAEWLADSTSDQAAFFEQGMARGTAGMVDGIDALNRLAIDNGTGSTLTVAETAIFAERLNGTQRILVENALSSKYDIAMLANDRYAGDAPALDHDFGVFGIGNDGTNSVLTGGHEGLGIEVGSLASNTWALAGHDDTANGVTTADLTDGKTRWQRTWYVDTSTASLSNVSLAFDWQDAGNTAPFDPSLISLYYRSGTSGLFTLVATGNVNIANQRVDFSGVTLQDGFFTLGSVPVPEPSTAALIGLGLAGLAARYRRHRAVRAQ